MTKAVLIKERFGDIREIDLDINPAKNQIFILLGGAPTFIGQWPDIDVVIMKAQNGFIYNKNTLPKPFDEEVIKGSVLLVRMDENSEPQDFSLQEYLSFARRHESITA